MTHAELMAKVDAAAALLAEIRAELAKTGDQSSAPPPPPPTPASGGGPGDR